MKKVLFLALPLLFLSGCSLIGNNKNAGDLQRISELEQQLSGLTNQLSGLQAENELLKGNLSGNTDINTNISTFSDAEIGVSFDYPISWGTITKDSETNNTKYLVMLLKNGNTFFAFHNGDTPLARGSFWGDEAKNINNSTYISNFCQNKTNCTINTNTNGIQYAKYYEEYGEMGSTQINTRLMYYIFNPNSSYRGIVMSNEKIPNESISDLNNIINSLSFL